MNIFEAIGSIDRSFDIEKGKMYADNLFIHPTRYIDIQFKNCEQSVALISKISDTIAVFQHLELVDINEELVNLPQEIQLSADAWAKYGWVPYLPTSKVNELIELKIPDSQDEADTIMMDKLTDRTINSLFEALQIKVKNHSRNASTFIEAVKCYKEALYSGCSLLLFAIIDSCFINGQPKPSQKSRRELAYNAVEKAIDNEKSSISVFACTAKLVIRHLFNNANDFSQSDENGLNRNYLSHGMNGYIPTQKDCLQLFVLLYNIYVSFEGDYFYWKDPSSV